MEKTMEKIVALAKSRGFVYPGSEIYGGLANTWDYGNEIEVELKNNVKKAWWQKFITESLQRGRGLRHPGELSDVGWHPAIWAASPTPSWTARTARSVSAQTS